MHLEISFGMFFCSELTEGLEIVVGYTQTSRVSTSASFLKKASWKKDAWMHRVSCSFSVLIATTRIDFVGKGSLKHRVGMLYFISVWHMGQSILESRHGVMFESTMSGQQCPDLATEACGKVKTSFQSAGLNMKCELSINICQRSET